MANSKRLVLSKKRLVAHYEIVVWVSLLTIVPSILFAKDIFTDDFKVNTGMWFLLIFPLFGLLVFINQYFALSLKPVYTNYSRSENYFLVRKTIAALQWKIRKDQKGFIEAINPYMDLLNWNTTMISIIISDNQIMINSISHPDEGISWPGAASFSFPFGQNLRNTKTFIKTFELFDTDHST